jgi:hypothetical protein
MKEHELNLILLNVNKTKKEFDLFIETGSYLGETINNLKSEFDKIISIEITEKYSSYCKKIFLNNSNVEIIKGDSVIELPKVIDKYINKKILFFLDAHCSAGDTGKNDKDVPLIEELKIIGEKYKNCGLIIIDDADLFEHAYPELTWVGINEKNVLNVLGDRVNNYFYLPDIRSINKKRLIIVLNKVI